MSDTARAGKSSTYVPGLDGLRALSIALVIGGHAGYDRIVPGGLGVTIFFAISGFLICRQLLDEFARADRIGFRSFYIRRGLRLYPELLAAVLLCLASAPLFPWRATWAETFGGLFYYMNYYQALYYGPPSDTMFPWSQLWSLAVEEHFYLVFPLILLVAARRDRVGTALAALIVAPLLWRCINYPLLHFSDNYDYLATDARIDSIAWGCLAAWALHRDRQAGRDPREAWYIHPLLVFAAAAAMLATLVIRDENFRWTIRFSIQGAALFVLVTNLLTDQRWRAAIAALEFRPIRYVGRIAYGMYLYNHLVNAYLKWWLPFGTPIFLLASAVCVIAAGSLSFALLDYPLKPLRRRFGSHVKGWG